MRSKHKETQSQVAELTKKVKEATQNMNEMEMQSAAKEESLQEQLSELRQNYKSKILELETKLASSEEKLRTSTSSSGAEEKLKQELKDALAQISSAKEEKEKMVAKIDKLRSVGIKWKMKYVKLEKETKKD